MDGLAIGGNQAVLSQSKPVNEVPNSLAARLRNAPGVITSSRPPSAARAVQRPQVVAASTPVGLLSPQIETHATSIPAGASTLPSSAPHSLQSSGSSYSLLTTSRNGSRASSASTETPRNVYRSFRVSNSGAATDTNHMQSSNTISPHNPLGPFTLVSRGNTPDTPLSSLAAGIAAAAPHNHFHNSRPSTVTVGVTSVAGAGTAPASSTSATKRSVAPAQSWHWYDPHATQPKLRFTTVQAYQAAGIPVPEPPHGAAEQQQLPVGAGGDDGVNVGGGVRPQVPVPNPGLAAAAARPQQQQQQQQHRARSRFIADRDVDDHDIVGPAAGVDQDVDGGGGGGRPAPRRPAAAGGGAGEPQLDRFQAAAGRMVSAADAAPLPAAIGAGNGGPAPAAAPASSTAGAIVPFPLPHDSLLTWEDERRQYSSEVYAVVRGAMFKMAGVNSSTSAAGGGGAKRRARSKQRQGATPSAAAAAAGAVGNEADSAGPSSRRSSVAGSVSGPDSGADDEDGDESGDITGAVAGSSDSIGRSDASAAATSHSLSGTSGPQSYPYPLPTPPAYDRQLWDVQPFNLKAYAADAAATAAAATTSASAAGSRTRCHLPPPSHGRDYGCLKGSAKLEDLYSALQLPPALLLTHEDPLLLPPSLFSKGQSIPRNSDSYATTQGMLRRNLEAAVLRKLRARSHAEEEGLLQQLGRQKQPFGPMAVVDGAIHSPMPALHAAPPSIRASAAAVAAVQAGIGFAAAGLASNSAASATAAGSSVSAASNPSPFSSSAGAASPVSSSAGVGSAYASGIGGNGASKSGALAEQTAAVMSAAWKRLQEGEAMSLAAASTGKGVTSVKHSTPSPAGHQPTEDDENKDANHTTTPKNAAAAAASHVHQPAHLRATLRPRDGNVAQSISAPSASAAGASGGDGGKTKRSAAAGLSTLARQRAAWAAGLAPPPPPPAAAGNSVVSTSILGGVVNGNNNNNENANPRSAATKYTCSTPTTAADDSSNGSVPGWASPAASVAYQPGVVGRRVREMAAVHVQRARGVGAVGGGIGPDGSAYPPALDAAHAAITTGRSPRMSSGTPIHASKRDYDNDPRFQAWPMAMAHGQAVQAGPDAAGAGVHSSSAAAGCAVGDPGSSAAATSGIHWLAVPDLVCGIESLVANAAASLKAAASALPVPSGSARSSKPLMAVLSSKRVESTPRVTTMSMHMAAAAAAPSAGPLLKLEPGTSSLSMAPQVAHVAMGVGMGEPDGISAVVMNESADTASTPRSQPAETPRAPTAIPAVAAGARQAVPALATQRHQHSPATADLGAAAAPPLPSPPSQQLQTSRSVTGTPRMSPPPAAVTAVPTSASRSACALDHDRALGSPVVGFAAHVPPAWPLVPGTGTHGSSGSAYASVPDGVGTPAVTIDTGRSLQSIIYAVERGRGSDSDTSPAIELKDSMGTMQLQAQHGGSVSTTDLLLKSASTSTVHRAASGVQL